jgi:hypothetical protein
MHRVFEFAEAPRHRYGDREPLKSPLLRNRTRDPSVSAVVLRPYRAEVNFVSLTEQGNICTA